jgi:hypothetical protein
VSVDPSNQHPILLNEPEPCSRTHIHISDPPRTENAPNWKHSTRGRLPSSGNNTFISVPSCQVVDPFRSGFPKTQVRVNPHIPCSHHTEMMVRNVCALCGDAATPGEHIQSDSLSKQDMPGFPSDGSDMFDGLERVPFSHMPLDPTKECEPHEPDTGKQGVTYSQPS